MPLFTLHALDKTDGGAAIRAANRSNHLEWAGKLGDRLRVGGPLLSDDGEQMIGSLLIIEAESLESLRAEMAEDPYAKAGLFERVTLTPFKWLIGPT